MIVATPRQSKPIAARAAGVANTTAAWNQRNDR
jgi:hypothetical protein